MSDAHRALIAEWRETIAEGTGDGLGFIGGKLADALEAMAKDVTARHKFFLSEQEMRKEAEAERDAAVARADVAERTIARMRVVAKDFATAFKSPESAARFVRAFDGALAPKPATETRCDHPSADGVDKTPFEDPLKRWKCTVCGAEFRWAE